jgi:hypothetical protein
VNRDFGGVRSRNQIDGADEVEELIARQPATAANELGLHQRDVRGGTAEAYSAEFEKDKGQLEETGSRARRVHRVDPIVAAPALIWGLAPVLAPILRSQNRGYALRSAATGSNFAARRAGGTQATAVTASRSPATAR